MSIGVAMEIVRDVDGVVVEIVGDVDGGSDGDCS